jgi:hypothetical protein
VKLRHVEEEEERNIELLMLTKVHSRTSSACRRVKLGISSEHEKCRADVEEFIPTGLLEFSLLAHSRFD